MGEFLPLAFSRNDLGDISGIREMSPSSGFDRIPEWTLNLSSNVVAMWNSSAIQDIPVCGNDPTLGQSLVYNGSQWCPSTVLAPPTPFTGQADSSSLQTYPVCTDVPTTNQVLTYDGAEWCPSTISFPTVPTYSNASSLSGTPLCPTAPTTGQSLVYNGSQWCPSTVTGVGGGGASGAPSTVEYLVLTADDGLLNERVFTPGAGIGTSDGGAGNNYTVSARHTSGIWNASGLQGSAISNIVATNGQVLTWSSTGAAWVASGLSLPNYAPSAAEYIVVTNTATLPNERAFSAGAGIGFSDGGAGGNFTVSAKHTSAVWNANALDGTDLAIGTPQNGEVLTWSDDATAWVPSALPEGVGSDAPADAEYLVLSVNGTLTNERQLVMGAGLNRLDGGAGSIYTVSARHTSGIWNASGLQGSAISTNLATNGQVLAWSGAGNAWVASTVTNPASLASLNGQTGAAQTVTVTSGLGILQGTNTLAIGANYTSAIWNASALQGKNLNATSPALGNSLVFDGTNWVASAAGNSGGGGGNGDASAIKGILVCSTTPLENEVLSYISGVLCYREESSDALSLAGEAICITPPIEGDVLVFDGVQWCPSAIPYVVTSSLNKYVSGAGSGVAGQLAIWINASSVVSAGFNESSARFNASALQGSAVSSRVATNGQIMAWSGTGNAWAASTITFPSTATSTVSSAGAISSSLDVVFINVSAGSSLNSVPSPVGIAGKTIKFLKIDGTGQLCQLSSTGWFRNNPNTSTIQINYPNEELELISDGEAWNILDRHSPFTDNSHNDLVYILEDFTNGSLEDGEVGGANWGYDSNGALTTLAAVIGRPGIIRRTCGTTNGVPAAIYNKETANTASFKFGDLKEFKGSIIVGASPNDVDYRVGISSDFGASNALNGMYFEKLAADPTWFSVTRLAGVQTRTDTGITASSNSTWLTLRVFIADASNVEFYINNQRVTVHTTNLPLTGTSCTVGAHIVPTISTARNISIDYFSYILMSTLERY